MKRLKISALCLGLILGAAGSASASTYDVTFNGPGFSGSGDMVVTNGIVTGVMVNGLGNVSVIGPTNTSGPSLYTQSGLSWLYDDKFLGTGTTPFDNSGLLLRFNNVVANVYSIGSQLYLSLSNPTKDYDPGEKINLSVSQTPLPPGLPLFLTAIVGLWFLLSRNRKSNHDAAVAAGHHGIA